MRKKLFCIALLGYLVSITQGQPIVTGKLVNTNGSPSAGAKVVFYPAHFMPPHQSAKKLGLFTAALCSTHTDPQGEYTIHDIDSGMYNIEGDDELGNKAWIEEVLLDPSLQINLPTDTLRPTGNISGIFLLDGETIHSGTFACIIGSNLITTTSPEGNFYISGVAEGNYTIRFIPLLDGFNVLDTNNVRVVSNTTTDLDSVLLRRVSILSASNHNRQGNPFFTILQEPNKISIHFEDSASVKNIEIELYDIFGARILVIPVARITRNIRYEISFAENNIPKGIYFVRINFGSISEVKTLLHMGV